MPYSKASYNEFKALNLPYIIDESSGTTASIAQGNQACSNSDHTGIAKPLSIAPTVTSTEDTPKTTGIEVSTSKSLSIVWNNKYFRIQMPYDKQAVSFIKNLNGGFWHAKEKIWCVRANVFNAQQLQDYFKYWDVPGFDALKELLAKTADTLIVELYQCTDQVEKIALKLKGYKSDFGFLKRIPERFYDKKYQRWLIPNDAVIIRSIIKHYEAKGAKIVNRLPEKNTNKYHRKNKSSQAWIKRLILKYPKVQHAMMNEYADKLFAQRYSISTIKSYVLPFGNFLKDNTIQSDMPIDAQLANTYLSKIAKTDISDSALNAVISALKFYFTKVIFVSQTEIAKIKRPRKARPLPTVLSTKEVRAILNATSNVKHRCLLFILYSSGLRRSEVLNLRMTDLLWERNQLYIKSAKGKKDRYVQFSDLAQVVMKDYVDQFQPQHWVFEGADQQTQYSASSVLKVVKQAAKKAGLTRRVTTHMLRHSFATHSLEYGIDISYIQKLLGHKDIRTTLMYTHITNKSLQQIKSPLDLMGMNDEKSAPFI